MSKVWRYGDHVDTDVIIPARYLNIADFDELAEHAMEDIDTTFAPNVQPGDYVVAGKNFGCGSSREHAPVVIKVKGVKCIIADGDELDVNMAAGEIKIVNKGITIQTKPLPEFIQKIADCGGLINYVKGEHQE